MKNELNQLKDICDKLEGYQISGIPEWIVTSATRLDNNTWRLEVEKPQPQYEAENQEADNVNK